jgi:hypothetical protein
MFLSIFDLLATLFLVAVGMAKEINPIMAPILVGNMPLFIAIKVGVSLFSCYIFYKYRDRKLVFYGVNGCCFIYIMIAIWHMVLLGIWFF